MKTITNKKWTIETIAKYPKISPVLPNNQIIVMYVDYA